MTESYVEYQHVTIADGKTRRFVGPIGVDIISRERDEIVATASQPAAGESLLITGNASFRYAVYPLCSTCGFPMGEHGETADAVAERDPAAYPCS